MTLLCMYFIVGFSLQTMEEKKHFDYTDTAWFIFAGSGGEKEIEKFIKEGIDVNYQDKNGVTALMASVMNGYDNIVKILLSSNANIYLETTKDFYIPGPKLIIKGSTVFSLLAEQISYFTSTGNQIELDKYQKIEKILQDLVDN